MKMRVLCFTLWYPNSENPILGTFVHEQAAALRERGLELRIVQPIPRAPFPITLARRRYRRLAGIPQTDRYDGFEVAHPHYTTLPRHFLFEHVGKWLYAGVRECVTKIAAEWPFDIIHAHTTYPCGYVANLLRDRHFPDTKVVHTIHRTCIVDAPNYNKRCRRNVRSALEGSDLNVFVSAEGQRLAAGIVGPGIAQKSEIVPNGVNPAQFGLTESDRVELSRLKAQHRDTWNLVFVGYVSERKGIKELLEAVSRLINAGRRNLRLFLVGRNQLGSYVEQFVRAKRMSDNIVMVGPVLHDRVKTWMNFADGFILPSHSEGVPTVLFEALYARAPSIFTAVGGVPDTVTDGHEALLIPPHSTPAIETSIARLMDDPAAASEMAERGHRLIRANFTWAHNAARHMELYEALLAEPDERFAAGKTSVA